MHDSNHLKLELKQGMAKAVVVKAMLTMMLASATLHAAEDHVSTSANDSNEGTPERAGGLIC